MDPLAGWTIAITAERRAAEQAELLHRRGAEVVLTPLVESVAVSEAEVRAATSALLEAPLDAMVIASGIGLRAWMAMSWTWDLGEQLTEVLHTAEVHARGAKAAGALVGEGVELSRRTAAETLSEVLRDLAARGLEGRRVGVQQHGGDMAWFLDALTAAGATVVPVPVYEVRTATRAQPASLLASAARRGGLDGVMFTSSMAVAGAAAVDGLVEDLRRDGVTCACVGQVTAAAAHDAGLPDIVVAEPHRLGSLVRALGQHLERRGRTLDVGGVSLRHQGARLSVDGHEVRLTPRERRLLEVMLATDGAVVSKERLAATAWDTTVDAHTVEVTVNRLRGKLGAAAPVLETSNRRGYRIAV